MSKFRLPCFLALALQLTLPPALLGQTPSPTERLLSQINSLAPSERQRELERGAKAEGKVLLYGTLQDDMVSEIFRLFRSRYPYIEAYSLRMGGKATVDRLLAEYRAGKVTGDVSKGGYRLAISYLFASHKSPMRPHVPEWLRAADDRGMHVEVVPMPMAYNTAHVKAEERPRGYEDLLHPRWKGLFSLDSYPRQVTGALIRYWGMEKARSFFEKLVANQVRLQRGRTIQISMLCAGEIYVAVGVSLDAVLEVQEKGCPVEIVFPDPLPVSSSNASIVNGAPHPHAAALLYDLLFTREVQEIVAKHHSIPARSDVPPKRKEYQLERLAKQYRIHHHTGKYEAEYDPMIAEILDNTVVRRRRG